MYCGVASGRLVGPCLRLSWYQAVSHTSLTVALASVPSRSFALLACAVLIGFRATPATAQPLWKIASTPITVVADDGTTATQWNAIAGAVLLSNGDVLIGDINGEVRRFSSAGHFLRLEVRQGRGPGEMTEIKKFVPWQDGGVALSWQQYLWLVGADRFAPRTRHRVVRRQAS